MTKLRTVLHWLNGRLQPRRHVVSFILIFLTFVFAFLPWFRIRSVHFSFSIGAETVEMMQSQLFSGYSFPGCAVFVSLSVYLLAVLLFFPRQRYPSTFPRLLSYGAGMGFVYMLGHLFVLGVVPSIYFGERAESTVQYGSIGLLILYLALIFTVWLSSRSRPSETASASDSDDRPSNRRRLSLGHITTLWCFVLIFITPFVPPVPAAFAAGYAFAALVTREVQIGPRALRVAAPRILGFLTVVFALYATGFYPFVLAYAYTGCSIVYLVLLMFVKPTAIEAKIETAASVPRTTPEPGASLRTGVPEVALQRRPDTDASATYLDEGQRALGRHEFHAAVAAFSRATERDATNAYAWFALGYSFDEVGALEDALECYDRALVLEPDHEKALFNKANALDELGRTDSALSVYSQLLEINPHHAKGWNNQGHILYRLGRQEDACACYRRSLELEPRFTVARENLAFCRRAAEQGQGRAM